MEEEADRLWRGHYSSFWTVRVSWRAARHREQRQRRADGTHRQTRV